MKCLHIALISGILGLGIGLALGATIASRQLSNQAHEAGRSK